MGYLFGGRGFVLAASGGAVPFLLGTVPTWYCFYMVLLLLGTASTWCYLYMVLLLLPTWYRLHRPALHPTFLTPHGRRMPPRRVLLEMVVNLV